MLVHMFSTVHILSASMKLMEETKEWGYIWKNIK